MLMHAIRRLVVVVVGALALAAAPAARAEEPWQTVSTGEVVVRTRPVPGSSVREIWAETDLRAEVRDLQDTLLDGESFPRFMPYAKQARKLAGSPEPDGAWFVYTRVAPPVIAQRDYVVKVSVDRSVEQDGSGRFQSRWDAVPGRVAPVDGVVRMAVNEGSWTVTPRGDGRSHVVYRFRIDPGGWIPPFLADLANQSGIAEVLRAVEREAQRRGAARVSSSRGPPASSSPTP